MSQTDTGTPSAARPLPLYFGPEGRPLCGWYHAPAGMASSAREGLVICSPIGQEDINAHQALRHLAKAAAEAGVHTLRFDYDGCGDSAGDDEDPDRVQAWQSSIHAAIDLLRQLSGATRVCLLGLRAGVLLASSVAATRADVTSLIAIAPSVNGRTFMREWTALARVREWAAAPTEGRVDADAQDAGSDDPIEAAGFLMSQSTSKDLQAIDLLQYGRAANEVLVIDRDDLPKRDRWSRYLEANGAKVVHEVLPGYRGMMSEPHNNRIPREVIARVLQWLSRGDAAAAEPEPQGQLPMPATASSARLVVHRHRGTAVRETLVQLEDDGLQFGVLTEPDGWHDTGRRRCLLLINSGACRHIGPNRMYVPFARHFAALGWMVLRLDVSGLGESEAHTGEPDNAPYTSVALRDIENWLKFLQRLGADELHLLGICSGAYHGFKAAVAGFPLTSVLPVNPLVFFWRDGMPLDPPLADHTVVSLAMYYQESLTDPRKWWRLLTGRGEVIKPTKILSRRAWARLKTALRRLARMVGIPVPDDLAAELRKIEPDATTLEFFFAAGDPGLVMLREQGSPVVDAMVRRGQVSISMLPATDHTFSTRGARRALLDGIEAKLLRKAVLSSDASHPTATVMASTGSLAP